MHRSRWLSSTLPVLAVAVMAAGCTSAAPTPTPTTAPPAAKPTVAAAGFAGCRRGGFASGLACAGREARCLVRGGGRIGGAISECSRRGGGPDYGPGESQGRVS